MVLVPGGEVEQALREAARTAVVLGVAGGDGTVNTAAGIALDAGLPLMVAPGGTLDHFAGELGVDGLSDVVAAVKAGEAVHVTVGSTAADGDGGYFLNTFALGFYPDLVTEREKREKVIGKWPAMVVAMARTVPWAKPVHVEVDGQPRKLWTLFAGNGHYHPEGFAPSWRDRLDDGTIDVRMVDADPPAGPDPAGPGPAERPAREEQRARAADRRQAPRARPDLAPGRPRRRGRRRHRAPAPACRQHPARRLPARLGMTGRDPAADLRAIAFCLERALEPSYRVKAFRSAAAVAETAGRSELERRAGDGTLTELTGIGKVTALVISESLAGEEPVYLRRVQTLGETPVAEGAAALRSALRGDLHTHSDWSDGGSPIEEMARAARDLGHEYVVLTDHSPRLTVANGLSADRLRAQLDVVAEVNERLAAEPRRPAVPAADRDRVRHQPGRVARPGAGLLAQLDLVVASVHSKLRMPRDEMTARMVAAISNPPPTSSGTAPAVRCSVTGAAGRAGRSRSSTPRWSSPPARSSASRSRSTAGPSASTRRSGCSASPSRPAATSRSTPTRTPPASSTGRYWAASGRTCAGSSRSGSSTPGPPTTCWPGRAGPDLHVSARSDVRGRS